MLEILLFLVGLGLTGIGVWAWDRGKWRESLLLIGFGLMGVGFVLPPAMVLGMFLLFIVVTFVWGEAFGWIEAKLELN